MIAKTNVLKGRKIAAWSVAAALGLIFALTVLFFVVSRSNEITSDLAKPQVVDLNKLLSADEVCIFDVGILGFAEIERRFPGYSKASGSDMLQNSSSDWSVAAVRHQEKKIDLYRVSQSRVHLVDGGSYCSRPLVLRIEKSGGEGDFWFAFQQRQPETGSAQ
jgi:hypothetical protein